MLWPFYGFIRTPLLLDGVFVLTHGSSVLGLSLERLGIVPTVGILWSGLLLITGFVLLKGVYAV